jgi:hypothetical protein
MAGRWARGFFGYEEPYVAVSTWIVQSFRIEAAWKLGQATSSVIALLRCGKEANSLAWIEGSLGIGGSFG